MLKTHKKAEFREAIFFPVNIFRTPDKLFDSVNDAESHVVKNDRIPFSILKVLIKISNCVGSTNMWVVSHETTTQSDFGMLFSLDLFDFE